MWLTRYKYHLKVRMNNVCRLRMTLFSWCVCHEEKDLWSNHSLMEYCHFEEVKTMVFPSTQVTKESSIKKIVLRRALSTVHPNIVIPPGLVCKYITAEKGLSISFLCIVQIKTRSILQYWEKQCTNVELI